MVPNAASDRVAAITVLTRKPQQTRTFMNMRMTSLELVIACVPDMRTPTAAVDEGRVSTCCLPHRAACCRRAPERPLLPEIRIRAEPAADRAATLAPLRAASAETPGSEGACGRLPRTAAFAAVGEAAAGAGGCSLAGSASGGAAGLACRAPPARASAGVARRREAVCPRTGAAEAAEVLATGEGSEAGPAATKRPESVLSSRVSWPATAGG